MAQKIKRISIPKIAKIYTQALAENFSTNADLSQALAELEAIKECFEANSDLNLVIYHPSVKIEEKRNILKKSLEGKVSSPILNLILILLERGRLEIISELPKYLKETLFERQNKAQAVVQSANPLSEKQIEEIRADLEKIFEKKLELETEIDESLIAGVKVNIGDKVLDSSVKSKLKQMKQLLAN